MMDQHMGLVFSWEVVQVSMFPITRVITGMAVLREITCESLVPSCKQASHFHLAKEEMGMEELPSGFHGSQTPTLIKMFLELEYSPGAMPNKIYSFLCLNTSYSIIPVATPTFNDSKS